MPVEPDQQQIAELTERAGSDEDGPLVMLNLNRYRDREAYGRYGVVALRSMQKVGAEVLWYADAKATVIGGDDESWDEVIAVWYPSAQAFLTMVSDPDYVVGLDDRRAGLERAAVLRCAAAPEPVLRAEALAA